MLQSSACLEAEQRFSCTEGNTANWRCANVLLARFICPCLAVLPDVVGLSQIVTMSSFSTVLGTIALSNTREHH